MLDSVQSCIVLTRSLGHYATNDQTRFDTISHTSVSRRFPTILDLAMSAAQQNAFRTALGRIGMNNATRIAIVENGFKTILDLATVQDEDLDTTKAS